MKESEQVQTILKQIVEIRERRFNRAVEANSIMKDVVADDGLDLLWLDVLQARLDLERAQV